MGAGEVTRGLVASHPVGDNPTNPSLNGADDRLWDKPPGLDDWMNIRQKNVVSARSANPWMRKELDIAQNIIEARDAVGDAPLGGLLLWLMMSHGDYGNSGRRLDDATSVAMEGEYGWRARAMPNSVEIEKDL